MFLAIAVLLMHPQVRPQFSFSAEKIAFVQAANSAANSSADSPTTSETVSIANVDKNSVTPGTEASTQDASNAPVQSAMASNSDALPDAPVPVISAGAPMAFIKPGKSMTVTVAELQAENRRKQLLWRGLTVASSGAATFDAWSTRHAITTAGAQELNPMLKPFAGNASLYAAIQVGPALMDYAGKKMMYSRHTWVRRMWWLPQSASIVSSIFCGAHNLAFH